MYLEYETEKEEFNELLNIIDNELRENKQQIINDEFVEIEISVERNGEYNNISISKYYFQDDITRDFVADDELENYLNDKFECFVDSIIDELKEKI